MHSDYNYEIEAPKVLIIGDSNTRDIDSEKFSGKMQTEIINRAFTCELATQELERQKNRDFDAIVLHVGTNHAKQHDQPTVKCSNTVKSMIDSALHNHPTSKIIVAPIPPSQNSKIDGKITDINSLVEKHFMNNDRISFVLNGKVRKREGQKYVFLKDMYHLSDSGTKILAGAIKRSIKEALFKNE